MGISGLFTLLKSIQRQSNLKRYAGQVIGVDAYVWLHRGTASCAIELAQGKPTAKFVDFAMNRVRMLVHFGITPYLVFDGDYLPSKAGTEHERAKKREESKILGLELLKVGKTSQAHKELLKAVDVTPEMARMFIEELKFHGIQYVVAPYEADSQLVYMEKQGIISGILSEDSDLLAFGAKCLITKLDRYGECVEVNRNLFTACREVSLAGWTDNEFRWMCILNGCDYLPGIGYMGLKRAHRMLRKHKTVERVVRAAQFDLQFTVPQGYLESFYQAERTFLHQWVFCPVRNEVVHLTELEPGMDVKDLPFIGPHVASDIAIGVANGNLNPHTKQPMVVNAVDRRNQKPLRPNQRSATVTQTPSGKGMRPIKSFFKPRRTPLAELEVNLFTPSQSQQALLEQQQANNGWAAVLAPSATGPTPASTSPRRARPRTSPSRRASAPITSRLGTQVFRPDSAPQQPKRQRLCSNKTYATSPGKEESDRSPFFATPAAADPSSKGMKSKRRRATDFDICSDDSFDEALVSLADYHEASTKPKKMSIFQDGALSNAKVSARTLTAVTNSTPSTVASSAASVFDHSQLSNTPFTPATAYDESSPGSEDETVFSAAISSRIQALRKYSYGATKGREEASPSLPRPKPVAKNNIATSQLSSQIRVVRTNKGIDCRMPEHLRTPGRRVSQIKRNNTVELEDSAWAAMEAEVVVAASSDAEPISSSPVRGSVVTKKVEIKGSEDMLVPDSEAESENDIEGESLRAARRPALDLERFAFNA